MQSIEMDMQSLLDSHSKAGLLVRQLVACEPCAGDITLYCTVSLSLEHIITLKQAY